jgi:hypothetical protein
LRRVARAGTGVRLINVAYGLHHDGKPIGYNSSSNWIAPRIHHRLTAMPLDILVRNVVLWGNTVRHRDFRRSATPTNSCGA